MALELTTVADDGAVIFDGPRAIVLDALNPDTTYAYEGIEFHTLPRPCGSLSSCADAECSQAAPLGGLQCGAARAKEGR